MTTATKLLPFGPLSLTVACASVLAEPTAEAITSEGGTCKSEEVRVHDAKVPFGGNAPASWWAHCGGRHFFCSQLHERVICSEVPDDFAGSPAK